MTTESCVALAGGGNSCGDAGDPLHAVSLSNVWMYSFIATILVSLCGVIPIVFIPLDGAESLNTPGGTSKLRMFLSFAVGSLLGDVFLHLLPEAWRKCSGTHAHLMNGLMVIFGILSFSFVEKLCESTVEEEEEETATTHVQNGKASGDNSSLSETKAPAKAASWATGYLNLFANCMDNFSHGLAIGGSFLVNFKVGALTTLAILLHEIPHEIGDFAILVRSGFSRRGAAKAQFLTAAGGLLGASAAIWFESAENVQERSSYILPFAAGGFLNIALVNLLPELLQEKRPIESLKQMTFLSAGVLVMATVTVFFES
ncbi:zinc transporter ZIP13-like [Paramacrobiotus metropolitanus]|uniref:zinc transporter ZIP13-like n=1 Tax=Paramacrobiotus metropolitanus TaxID=2943436 RepID=UPI002445D3BD|nr:zinc transporter ZIP13-like [Paramacrobiotus metropolitanus]